MTAPRVCIVVPNWNGAGFIAECVASLLAQNHPADVIVVDNASADASVDIIKSQFPKVTLLENPKNLGFAGGVNTGIRYALDKNYGAVALFNNDAVADTSWLKELMAVLQSDVSIGIVTSKLLDIDKKRIDSTGDMYSNWGLPFPRGRGEPVSKKFDTATVVFGASGGASVYRAAMLREVGLFDEDFFAYLEDVDLSFRAQLRGWQVRFAPKAEAYHRIGATSGKIKGFVTYHTLKNLPLLFWKNMPKRLVPSVWIRLMFAYNLFILRAIARGQIWPAIKGPLRALWLWPKKLRERKGIQAKRTVSDDYIRSIMTHDLPPAATRLRALRGVWWKLTGKAQRT